MGSPLRRATPKRTKIFSLDQDHDSPLPPIQERLAYLRPSRELLEFYRQKIAQYDTEHEDLLKMLEKYRSVTEDQLKIQHETRQREREIADLQNALSDMQVYLFQEREQSLRLYAENDRLKIRELEDRKKIQQLLAHVGPDAGVTTYFHQEPPHKVSITQRRPEPRMEGNLCLKPTKLKQAAAAKDIGKKARSTACVNAESLEQYKNENQTLLLQVEALQAQMEEQTRLAKEQVEALLEDRKIKMEEARVQQLKDQERITALTEKLQQTQSLLHDTTKDFLQLKFDTRTQEKSWMVEKDQLLRELDSCHDHLGKGRSGGAESGRSWQPSSSRTTPHLRASQQAQALQEDLKQAHQLADMYREQCINLERELSQIREEGDAGREIFKERSEKMAKHLQLTTQRYKALEKRRLMEVEGYKTDLKHLRQKLKDVEKQLIKVTLNIGSNQDQAILHEVRQTNTRTKNAQSELMALKAKIYGLENQLRFC